MAIYKTCGLILRSIKYRETSIIVDIYTREKGLRSFVVNGVRKPRARFSSSLFQHGTIVQMVAYEGGNASLARIKEIEPGVKYTRLPFEVEKSSIALFLLEVIRKSIREHEPNPELYDFLEEWFQFLDSYEGSHGLFHIKFLCEYASYIGIQPINNWSQDSPYLDLELGHFVSESNMKLYSVDEECSRAISEVLYQNKVSLQDLHYPKEIRIKMLEQLIRFYKVHIHSFNELKSFEVLRQIF